MRLTDKLAARIGSALLRRAKRAKAPDKIATMNILRAELGMPEYRGGR